VTVCLSIFISINYLTILSSVAIAGGLYFFFVGFQLLARKRLLLTTPASKIRSAALGLVEVTGAAAGPYNIRAHHRQALLSLPHHRMAAARWQEAGMGESCG